MEKVPAEPLVKNQPPAKSAMVALSAITGDSTWTPGFWECFKGENNLCALAFFCPCIVHGRTQWRLRETPMEDYQACLNSDCWLYFVTAQAGVHWVMPLKARRDIRRKFNMPGSCFGDFMASLFCDCCVLMQHEKELIHRNKPKATEEGYVRQPPMSTGAGA